MESFFFWGGGWGGLSLACFLSQLPVHVILGWFGLARGNAKVGRAF